MPKIIIEISGGLIQWIGATEQIDIELRDLDLKDEKGNPDIQYRDPDSFIDEDGNEEGVYDEYHEE